jgi:proteasome lid subunit RPN8/RPN11
MDRLRLPRPLVNQILTQAQHSPEAEICGLIATQNGTASRCYPVHNAAADPVHRYRMEPQAQIEALRQMREAGEELLAIYHSHPHTPATPSAIDIEEANYPDAVYLIISLDIKGVLQISAFCIANGTASPLVLELL